MTCYICTTANTPWHIKLRHKIYFEWKRYFSWKNLYLRMYMYVYWNICADVHCVQKVAIILVIVHKIQNLSLDPPDRTTPAPSAPPDSRTCWAWGRVSCFSSARAAAVSGCWCPARKTSVSHSCQKRLWWASGPRAEFRWKPSPFQCRSRTVVSAG